MDKNAKTKVSGVVILVTVVALAILGVLVYALFFRVGGVAFGTPSGPSGPTVGGGCNQNPSLRINGMNALTPNANVTPTTYYYRVNDAYIGTGYATPILNDKVDLIGDLAGYLAAEGTKTIACGPNALDMQLYQFGNATISIYTDAGTAILSNNIGADVGLVNETQITLAGGTKNWKVHIVSQSKRSTGKMLMVVEFPPLSNANISSSSVSFSGLPAVTIPAGVSTTGTSPFRIAFEIPELKDGEVRDYNLQMSTLSGKALDGMVKIIFFHEQLYVDTDGQFKTGTYDSLGNAVYQDFQNYDFGIGVESV